VAVLGGGIVSTWAPISLADHRGGAAEHARVFKRADGVPLLYAGRVNGCHGPAEAGKGFFASSAVAQELWAGNLALYIDFEDGPANEDLRLRQLGVPADVIDAQLRYVRPEEALGMTDAITAADVDLADLLRDHEFSIGVIDGVNAGMELFNLGESNADYARFYRLLPKQLADAGMAVLTIDHVPKNGDNRRFAIGAQHKKAMIRGASYSVEAREKFGAGRHGITVITVEKDTPGDVRQHAREDGVIAELHLVSDPDTHEIVAELLPPATTVAVAGSSKVDAVVKFVADNPGETTTAVMKAIGGGSVVALDAVHAAEAEGRVRAQSRGNAKLWYPAA
jgi:hypothetical protein